MLAGLRNVFTVDFEKVLKYNSQSKLMKQHLCVYNSIFQQHSFIFIRIYFVIGLFVCFLQKPTREYDICLAYSHKEQWEVLILTEKWAHESFSVFKKSHVVNDRKALRDHVYEVSKPGHLKYLHRSQNI